MRGRLMLAVMLLGLLVPAAKAQAGWSRGPDMLQGRIGAAATLLHDGSVLMIGGRLSDLGFAGVERLDPGHRAWTPTGSLLTPRQHPNAVTLADGSVLSVGGWWWDDWTDAERYDPAAGTWSRSGSDVFSEDARIVTLPDGRALVIEGGTSFFDPATGTWSRGAQDPELTEGHSATLLGDGQVLVASGREWLADYFWWFTPEVRIYDPAANTWRYVASMPEARFDHLAERLPDGRVLVFGGFNWDVGSLTSALLYDPVADRWTQAAPLPPDFRPHAAVQLRDGSVMAIGDYDPDRGVTASMRYDPATDAWSAPEPLLEDRGWDFTATLLRDGRVLVAGGYTPHLDGFSRTTEIWTPPRGRRRIRGRA